MLSGRSDVLGEAAPRALPPGLLVVAVALAAVFVREVSASAGESAPVAPVPEPPTASEPATARPEPRSDATAPASTASPGSPRACPNVLVAFRSGEASPSADVMRRLRALGAEVAAVPGATIVVDGHADSLGSDDLNLRLSKRRAEAIAWSLERGGLDRARVTSRGFGAFTPVEGVEADGAENRRAVIHVRGACPRQLTEVLGP